MRKELLLASGIMAFALTAVGSQAPVTVEIQGTVTRTGTSEAIPDVQVSLTNGPGGFRGNAAVPAQALQPTFDGLVGLGLPAVSSNIPNAMRGGTPANTVNTVNTTVKTDRDGRFVLGGLTPGNYLVRIEREGYFGEVIGGIVPPSFITRPVIITAGQPVPNLDLSLTPGSAVSGRATDAEGRPVVGAQVQAFGVYYQDGRALLRSSVTAMTDDRGEFRLFRIPPGQYYLSITPRPSGRGARGASLAPREGLVRTFFPDALDAESGRMMTLRGGEDLTGTTISVRSSSMVTVSGQIIINIPVQSGGVGPRGQTLTPRPNLILSPRGRSGPTEANPRAAGAAINPDGTFQIQGVPPGAYDLYAALPAAASTFNSGGFGVGGPSVYFGRVPLDVGFQDIQGISISINPGVEVKAFASVDGSPAGASNIRLALQQEDTLRAVTARAVALVTGPDGSITIPSVNEGLYRLVVTLPGVAQGRGNARGQRGTNVPYVEDIREGGASVYDKGLLVGKEAPRPVEIIVKTDSGNIEGNAYDSQQQLKGGATVALVPPDNRRRNPALYKLASTDSMGRFAFNGVAPGRYKIFAWESIPSGAHQNPEFIAKYEERGTAITVNPAATTNAQVTVTRADR